MTSKNEPPASERKLVRKVALAARKKRLEIKKLLAEENAPDYSFVRTVTLPLFNMAIGVPYFVKIVDRVYSGKLSGSDDPQMLLDVFEISTGEKFKMAITEVLNFYLKEEYPNMEYVHKSFKITKFSTDRFRVEEIKINEKKETA